MDHPQRRKQQALEQKIGRDLERLSESLGLVAEKLAQVQAVNERTVVTAKLQEAYNEQRVEEEADLRTHKGN